MNVVLKQMNEKHMNFVGIGVWMRIGKMQETTVQVDLIIVLSMPLALKKLNETNHNSMGQGCTMWFNRGNHVGQDCTISAVCELLPRSYARMREK